MMKKYISLLMVLIAVFSVSGIHAQREDDRRWRNRGVYDRDVYNRNDGYYGNNRYNRNWIELGSRKISSRDNYERIPVKGHRSRGISQLRLDLDRSISISRVAVRYDNGRTEELSSRNIFNNGRMDRLNNGSATINLPRYNGTIREVMVWYNDYNNDYNYGRRARGHFKTRLTVYGR